jgi:hypothetical protein
MRIAFRLGVLAILVLLGACTYREGGVGNPLTRRFQYFSYLGGDDIRRDCTAGTPARYRLVYNASYLEQVRTYDLRRNPRAAVPP